ncbi:hypothetical protein V5O48_009711 [Marasmius crinis-equi]|uniref:Uncharacterized protein n=1 Tax=Marasmius crinis-equi TaxID=585013 RepID=A0ABR3FAX1_9AGAR
MSKPVSSARKQPATVSPRKKASTVVHKKDPVPELLPSPALVPAPAVPASPQEAVATGAPKRGATTAASATTPPKLLPKKRKADRESGGDPTAVDDLNSLTLNTPARRSPRKPVPTEKAQYNIEQAMADLPQTPPGRQKSWILQGAKRRMAEADANDAACASDTATTISWSPSPKPKARARPLSRPKAVPRSKWPSPPSSQASPSRSVKGKNKAVIVSSDEEDDAQNLHLRELTPFEESELPTLTQMVSAFGDSTSHPSSALFDDIAVESGAEEDSVHDDNLNEAADEDQYDLDDSFIDDSGAPEYDSDNADNTVEGRLDLEDTYEPDANDPVDEVEYADEDPVDGGDDDLADSGDEVEFVDQDEEGLYDDPSAVPAQAGGDDCDDDLMSVDVQDDNDITLQAAPVGQNSSLEDDLFPFDCDANPSTVADEHASDDEPMEYLGDFPPVSSKPGNSFRPSPRKVSAKEAKQAKERQGQQALPFSLTPASSRKAGAQLISDKSTGSHVGVSATPRAKTNDSKVASSSTPSASAPERAQVRVQTASSVSPQKAPAKSVGGVRTTRAPATPGAAGTSSSPFSTTVARPSVQSSSPLRVGSAAPSAPPPAPDPNSALDESLQSPKMRFIYRDLPAKARVSRATVYSFKGCVLPTALPYDGEFALGLCTDDNAKRRLVKALRFDSYSRILSLNRNGNVPVRDIRFECVQIQYAGRFLPAVYVNTGFIWTSDLQGVRGNTKNVLLRSMCQEWELLQGGLGRILTAQEFQAHLDTQNGAMMFATKKLQETENSQGRTDAGRGVGRTLPPVVSTTTSNHTELPACALKKHLRFDESVPVFDGRTEKLNNGVGFLSTPDDWKSLDTLPRFPDGEDLPEDALVTVGFTVSGFGPLSGMSFKGVNLLLLFIIVLDLPKV